MRRTWVLLLVVGVVAALGPAAVADTDPRVPGKHQWTRQFGTDQDDYGYGVAVDASGVYVAGYTGEALPGQAHRGGRDVFVRAYTHDGNHRWIRQFGTDQDDEGWGIAVHTSGVYVVGYTMGTLPGQTRQGGRDAFVRAYDAAGKHRWTRQFGTIPSDSGYGVAINASGVYVTGYTAGAFPGQSSQGGLDGFVRAYTHDGKHRWTRQFGTSGRDEGLGVAVNASGVYVTGFTEGAFPGWTHQGVRDAFVRAYSHTGQHQWLRQFGTGDWDEGRGIAAGAAAVYVTGYVEGALPNQTHQGWDDVFLRRYATE